MSVPVQRNALPKVISATDGYEPAVCPPTIAIEGVAEVAKSAPATASTPMNLLPLRFMESDNAPEGAFLRPRLARRAARGLGGLGLLGRRLGVGELHEAELAEVLQAAHGDAHRRQREDARADDDVARDLDSVPIHPHLPDRGDPVARDAVAVGAADVTADGHDDELRRGPVEEGVVVPFGGRRE